MTYRATRCCFLYLVGQLGPGGLERQLCYLLEAMDRDRYRPEVAVWNLSPSDEYVERVRYLGVCVHSCGDKSGRAEKLYSFRKLVDHISPEVVHSYSFYTNFAAWWAARGNDRVAIGSIRNSYDHERRVTGTILGRLSSRWPVSQICNSEAARHAVQRSRSAFKPSRLYVVRNGLDLSRFTHDPDLPEFPTFLAVGRLYPQKRWDRLLRVLASVAASGGRFLVRHAGQGPLLGHLRAEADRLGLQGVVEFLGFRKDIDALLSKSTALIHTADDEGCPNVVMEAMASGRAVVATDAGDVPLLVDDGVTGFVVRRGDDRAMVERVTALVNSRDLCRRMGTAARIKAERNFSLNRLVSDTLGAYRAAGWTAS